MSVGAKTKGWIRNNITGVLKSFQFNPTELSHSRGSTFAEIVSPGMPYPLTQFVHGNAREFSVNLYLFDAPRSSGVIRDFVSFIESFLPPEVNVRSYTKPPDMTFCFGTWIKKCVCSNVDVTLDRLDDSGEPIEAHLTLTLRQVGM